MTEEKQGHFTERARELAEMYVFHAAGGMTHFRIPGRPMVKLGGEERYPLVQELALAIESAMEEVPGWVTNGAQERESHLTCLLSLALGEERASERDGFPDLLRKVHGLREANKNLAAELPTEQQLADARAEGVAEERGRIERVLRAMHKSYKADADNAERQMNRANARAKAVHSALGLVLGGLDPK